MEKTKTELLPVQKPEELIGHVTHMKNLVNSDMPKIGRNSDLSRGRVIAFLNAFIELVDNERKHGGSFQWAISEVQDGNIVSRKTDGSIVLKIDEEHDVLVKRNKNTGERLNITEEDMKSEEWYQAGVKNEKKYV